MVIHSHGAGAVTQRFYMGIDFVSVLVARVLRCDLQTLAGFKVDQNGGLAQLGPNFLRIEHVKQHNLVSVEAQRFNGANDSLRRFIKIRDDQNYSSAPEKLLEVMQRFAKIGASAGFGELEPA